MSRRGDATREHLLDVAEQLYGERGIAAVSLREIRLAAGSRNTAAMQFHFGDRDGLLDALIARHMPRIAQRQQVLYDELITTRRQATRRRLVEVLVRPVAEYATGQPQERAWVKIMAELASLPDLHLKEMASVAPDAGIRAGAELFEQLRRTMPSALARERLIVLAQSSVHTAADYARLQDNPTDSRRHLKPNAFIENLIDMRTGALFAPVSEAAQAACRR
jgi:AcrR family transcriptional regulator